MNKNNLSCKYNCCSSGTAGVFSNFSALTNYGKVNYDCLYQGGYTLRLYFGFG